jgi:ABC-type multidrug transport system ATPase subunit
MSRVLWRLNDVCLQGKCLPRLEGINLEIEEGKTAVIGQSGAGKTSLLNLLVGFERPDRGVVHQLFPEAPQRLPLFWVPQDGGLWPHMKAREHLEVVIDRGDASGKAMSVLSAFGIQEKADSYPAQLSQGERERLSVARAISSRATVLVMDEPLVSVDIARAGKCWEAVRNHLAETRASVVFATHSPQTVLSEAEKVVCLNEGRLLYSGSVEDLYLHPATPELADCLGENNWLSPQESSAWLGRDEEKPLCCRPEHIAIIRAKESHFVVQSARFKGSIAEADLKNERTGAVRRFYHRPASNFLRPDDHVILKLLLCLLMFVTLLPGCGGGEPVIAISGQTWWSLAPDGTRIPAPRSVAVCSDGEVFILDTAGRVLVYDENGLLKRQWRMPDPTAGNPEGVCVLRDGSIAVADTHYSRVIIFDKEGKIIRQFGRYGTGEGEFIYPVALAEDEGRNLYVCEYGSNDRVQKFAPDGRYIGSFGTFGTRPGQFQRPSGMVWHRGNLYVADSINNRIQVFSDRGEFIRVLGASSQFLSLNFPYDMALGPDNALYVVEYGAGRVTKIDLDGKVLGRYGSSGTGAGQFRTPWGIAVDLKKHLFVADTGNRRMVVLKQ